MATEADLNAQREQLAVQQAQLNAERAAAQNKQLRQQQILDQNKKAREADMAEGRARGQELFGEGSNFTRDRETISGDVQDIIGRRKSALEGMSGAEQAALRSQALDRIAAQQQGASRQLRGIQAQAGLQGATAASQQAGLLGQAQKSKGEIERDLFLQDLANRDQALGAFEQTIGGETQRSQQEKLGQLSTELSYAQLGSGERAAVAQQLIGEDQAAAAAAKAQQNQGKK